MPGEVERWSEQESYLRAHGGEYKLNTSFKKDLEDGHNCALRISDILYPDILFIMPSVQISNLCAESNKI